MDNYKRSALLFIAFSVFIIVSCASTNMNLEPLMDKKPRISSLGFSFVPPPGENWSENFNNHTIRYLKKTDPKKGSFFTNATEYNFRTSFSSPDEFLNFVKNKRLPTAPSDRYKNSKGKYKLDSDFAPFCVRYHERYEDHGAKNLYGREYLVVENLGMICLHPENPKVAVDIYYSERYAEGEKNMSYRGEGEEFVNSLKFLPLNQQKK